MEPYFHKFFKAIVKRVPDCTYDGAGRPTPELAGKVFECLSFLLKFYLPQLVEKSKEEKRKAHDSNLETVDIPIALRGPEQMRVYYGELFGSHSYLVRDFAAKSFSIMFRKLKGGVFKSHYRKVVKALAMNCKVFLATLAEAAQARQG